MTSRTRLIVGIALLVAACANPTPTPSASASPTATATPSPAPSTTPSPTVVPDPTPKVTCTVSVIDSVSPAPVPSVTLSCGDAIDTALAALPSDHPAIDRIEFRVGHYCPPDAFCPIYLGSENGYVVLFFGDDTALWVAVRADGSGRASILGDFEPYPTSTGSFGRPESAPQRDGLASRSGGSLARTVGLG
jgi:hypothetical protein